MRCSRYFAVYYSLRQPLIHGCGQTIHTGHLQKYPLHQLFAFPCCSQYRLRPDSRRKGNANTGGFIKITIYIHHFTVEQRFIMRAIQR